MSWQSLATIQTSQNWTLIQPVTGSVFRISHNVTGINIQSLRAVVAQAFTEDNVNTYFDFRRVTYKPEIEGFIFIQPAGLLNRSLAIKRLDNLADIWTIAIEVLDGMPESISLPIEISEVTGLLEELQARVSRLEFVSHIADTENPHNVTAAQVGAERPGAGAAAAAAAIAFHVENPDPHAQYAENTQIVQLETAISQREAVGTAAAAIATHETTTNHPIASGDPEMGYQQGFISANDKAKLDTVTLYATANATDAQLRTRSTHTGTQGVETITGLGNAATRNVGTTAGTVAAGDDTRLTNARTPTGTASGVLSGSYPNPSFAAGVFARSLGNPGWEKLHSGKVHEWGSTIVTLNSNGDGGIALPLALSTAVYSFSVVNGDANTFGDRIFSCNINSLNAINVSVRPNPGAVNVRVNWSVIGS